MLQFRLKILRHGCLGGGGGHLQAEPAGLPHAMQKLQIQDTPAICFVSANCWDAQVAAQYGFQVVRLARGGGQDDRIPGKVAARSLNELAGLN